jgi:1-acyl-sn-glycerol-3-phosphate acyltransferase
LFRSVVGSIRLAGYFLVYSAELVLTRPKTRAARAAWLNRFCASVLRGMDLTVNVHGKYPERGALIANHTGYADIVLLAGLHPCVFCSKAEIAKWPVLGWMATMSGSVFVERGSGGSAERAKSAMQSAVDDGLPVTFFPEGTTTDGTGLLPFRSGLLAQVLEANAPVTAAYIQYSLTKDNGPGVSVINDVCYWGTVNIVKHMFGFMGLRGVHAEVYFAPGPIAFQHGIEDRKAAAVEARDALLAVAASAGVDLSNATPAS